MSLLTVLIEASKLDVRIPCQSAVTRGIDKDILVPVTESTALGLVSTSPVRVGWAECLECHKLRWLCAGKGSESSCEKTQREYRETGTAVFEA